jgi:hypothetical protein
MGITFARLFSGQIPGTDTPLNPREKKQLSQLKQRCKKQMPENYDKEISDIITCNFNCFLFYKKVLMEIIETGNLSDAEVFIYKNILLEMIEPEPGKRPGIDAILEKINRWESEKKPKPAVKYEFDRPLFGIPGTNTIIVNLHKKKIIDMGRWDGDSEEESVNDIGFRFYNISRRQLQIRFKESLSRVYVEDVGSRFGTFVNGTRLQPGKVVPLKNRDILRMGKIICFEFLEGPGCYFLKNVTQREKKGLIAWLSPEEGEEGNLPAANAEIVLIKEFAAVKVLGKDIRLEIDKESGNISSESKIKMMPPAALPGAKLLKKFDQNFCLAAYYSFIFSWR